MCSRAAGCSTCYASLILFAEVMRGSALGTAEFLGLFGVDMGGGWSLGERGSVVTVAGLRYNCHCALLVDKSHMTQPVSSKVGAGRCLES